MDFNQATFTTKYVIETKSKVVYVSHDKDGWQFFGVEKEIVDEDMRITSLKNMIKLNPHVEKILWIPEGMEAWINNENEEWQTGVATCED